MEEAASQPLNSVQLHLLKIFQFTKDEERLTELKNVLFDFYCKKVDEEADRLWKERNMSNETMRELKNAHFRTPYQ